MDKACLCGCFFGVGLSIGFIFAYEINTNYYQTEAIKRGYAHYDTKTGNFVWNHEEKNKQ